MNTEITEKESEMIINADRIKSGLKPDSGHRSASFLTQEELMSEKLFTLMVMMEYKEFYFKLMEDLMEKLEFMNIYLILQAVQ